MSRAKTKRRSQPEPAKSRMLDKPEPVQATADSGDSIRMEPDERARNHWSACPKCGASLLSTGSTPTPVCRKRGERVEGKIHKYQRCRNCGHNYQTFQPDA